jgi:hypothetical protein
MNADEENLIHAYFDGELPPAERPTAESLLVSDPHSAEVFLELGGVRDLIAGLSRPPCPGDLSASVLAVIGPRRGPGLSTPVRSGWPVRVLATISTAAAVFTAFASVTHHPGDAPGRPPTPHRIAGLATPPGVTPAPAPAPGRGAEPAPRSSLADSRSRPASPASGPGGEDDERERVRGLLDNPNLTKVFLLTDVLGGDAGGRVGKMLEKTPRRNPGFGRITLSQGIVFDREHPGEATVFAVVMDDDELRQFRADLAGAFPAGVKETESTPSLVTQLGDVGQVAVLNGTPVGELIESDVPTRALRSEPAKNHAEGSRLVAEAPAFEAPPDADEGRRSIVGVASADRRDGSPPAERVEPQPADRERPGSRRSGPAPSVVLVWVSARRPS